MVNSNLAQELNVNESMILYNFNEFIGIKFEKRKRKAKLILIFLERNEKQDQFFSPQRAKD